MRIRFPAMKGTIGGRTYYSTLMKLNVVPKMFTFAEWTELDPREREQRKLNTKRVPDIARYVAQNEGEGYIFSSITASYKCGVNYIPTTQSDELGFLEMDLSEANFLINDGQHRAAAIEQALNHLPSLADETISILLFPYENKARAQQMFSDLNRYVKKTSKALDILFDKRDVLSVVTIDIAEQVPAFKGLVDMESASLPAGSKMLFSLAALYDANHELLREQDFDTITNNELLAIALDFWATISKVMPDWGQVKRGEVAAKDFRQASISSHSVVLRALGSAGADLIKAEPENWKNRLEALKTIDWRKTNPDWENVNIVANSVASNRQARAATKAYIKQRLGLALSESEMKSITKPAIIQAA